MKRLSVFVVLALSALLLAACGGSAPAQGWSSAALDGKGTLYFGATVPKVFALDAANGNKKWEYAGEKDKPLVTIYGTPAVANDKVYFGAYDGVFYALDAATGALKWQFSEGAPIVPAPLVGKNGLVYFGANNYKFYALDANTGAKKWEFAASEKVWGDAALDEAGTTIYFGSLDQNLYALDANTGAKKWSYPAGGLVVSTPLITGGNVYFGALNHVLAVDAATGTLRWKIPLDPSDWVWSDFTTRDGVIYFGTLNGKVYALDAATGTAKWGAPLTIGSQIRSAIVLSDTNGFFGASDQKVYAYNLDTGQNVWTSAALSGPVLASPVLQGDILYVPSHGYNMYALRADNGSQVWCFDANAIAACK